MDHNRSLNEYQQLIEAAYADDSHPQQPDDTPPQIYYDQVPHHYQNARTGFGRMHAYQQQRQQQSPHYLTQPVQTGFGLRQPQTQQPYHHRSQPVRTGPSQQQQAPYHSPASLQAADGQPLLLSSLGLRSLPSEDHQPLHGGIVQSLLQPRQSDLGSSPRQTAYGDSYALGQQSSYNSPPQWAGFGQPTQHQQSSFGFDHRGPASDSRGAQTLPLSHDYQLLRGGLVQRRSQHEHPSSGYSPQQTGDSYALGQQSSYDGQPQRASFGQPPATQNRVLDFGFSHREEALSRRAPPAPSNAAGSESENMSGDALRAWNKRHGFLALEFEDMSRDALKAWNKEHGLPTSHNRKILIQQARTRIGVKVTPRGRRRNRNFNLEGTAEENPKSNMPELEGTSAETAVELESDVDITEHTFEDPEDSRYRDDANEPGTGSYFYDSAS